MERRAEVRRARSYKLDFKNLIIDKTEIDVTEVRPICFVDHTVYV